MTNFKQLPTAVMRC